MQVVPPIMVGSMDPESSTVVLPVCYILGAVLLVIGLMSVAKYKGRNAAWGLIGMLGCLGLLLMLVLKDMQNEKK